MSNYLKRAQARPEAAGQQVRDTVSQILLDVERRGEAALRHWSEQLDDWSPASFRVSDAERVAAAESLDPALRADIDDALAQVRTFAAAQRATLTDLEVETLPGVVLGHRHVPVGNVGSYSPGGRYPLVASSIMTVAVPKVAGVPRVVACAPPRNGQGIHPPQLYAMSASGADEVFCFGGVQALAAMAFGIDGLEPVDLIVGPGNAYVAEAKRQLFGPVGIDLIAGPSEILVIADGSADPELVAADLLGQAEHGPTSPAVLVCDGEEVGRAVAAAVDAWLERWPTADVAGAAWRDFGEIVVCADREEMAAVSDRYAPEHLELQTTQDAWFEQRLTNYGSLFVGARATVAYGDKAIGVNHVLPTERAARYTGGLWVGKFLKTLTYQRLTDEGTLRIAPVVASICDAEEMAGHAITARLRLEAAAAGVAR
ncbi:MAG: hpsN 2 [Conexibacter sp.]|nr:hpsN 2 [Conexibacter sp.]